MTSRMTDEELEKYAQYCLDQAHECLEVKAMFRLINDERYDEAEHMFQHWHARYRGILDKTFTPKFVLPRMF